MRILLVHNFYGSSAPSGENRVVLEERDLLRANGHDVVEHFTHSDSIPTGGLLPVIRAGLGVPWNPAALNRLRRRIEKVEPDVMHVHNVFPLLSPSIFQAAKGTGTAVVNTLHNYRTLCAKAIPLRGGAVCTQCIDTRSVAPALRYGCYRNSRLATVPMALAVAVHRKLDTYSRRVDAFIALTEFQKSVLVAGGLPAQRIYVKPNCYPGARRPSPWIEREDKAVFLGRASAEKGLDTLVEAWIRWGHAAPKLEIIGEGPDLERLRGLAAAAGADRIEFAGSKPAAEAHLSLSKAKLLIVPSTCFEGCPLVLPEAFAFGVPIVASRLGTFEELVEDRSAGRLFTAGDPGSLLDTVRELWRDQPALEALGGAARKEFEARYSAGQSIGSLKTIYEHAIENKKARSSYKGTLVKEALSSCFSGR
jgi:glycosyltransferase involved in cell wall biosynthesis